MKLRSPTPTGTTSQAGDDLQHAAANRIRARIEADAHKEARRAGAKAFRRHFTAVVLLGVLLLGLWAWRSGMLESLLRMRDGGQLGDLFETPAAEGDVQAGTAEPKEMAEQILDRVKKVVQDVKTAALPESAEKEKPAAASLVDRFAGAAIDYWKNALPEDRPGKKQVQSFTGLVPREQGGFDLLEIEMGGGRFAVKRVDAANGAETLEKATFNKLIAKTPYLVARQGRVYFCSAGQGDLTKDLKVPAPGGALDPSRAEFGPLADCLAAAKVKTPAFRYAVSLAIEKLNKTLPVATVGFGESVPRSAFEAAVGTLVADKEMVETLLAVAKVQVKPAK